MKLWLAGSTIVPGGAGRPASIAVWIPEDVVQRVTAAVRQVGGDRLKPIFLALGEKVPYDDIRLVLAYLQSRMDARTPRIE